MKKTKPCKGDRHLRTPLQGSFFFTIRNIGLRPMLMRDRLSAFCVDAGKMPALPGYGVFFYGARGRAPSMDFLVFSSSHFLSSPFSNSLGAKPRELPRCIRPENSRRALPAENSFLLLSYSFLIFSLDKGCRNPVSCAPPFHKQVKQKQIANLIRGVKIPWVQ